MVPLSLWIYTIFLPLSVSSVELCFNKNKKDLRYWETCLYKLFRRVFAFPPRRTKLSRNVVCTYVNEQRAEKNCSIRSRWRAKWHDESKYLSRRTLWSSVLRSRFCLQWRYCCHCILQAILIRVNFACYDLAADYVETLFAILSRNAVSILHAPTKLRFVKEISFRGKILFWKGTFNHYQLLVSLIKKWSIKL